MQGADEKVARYDFLPCSGDVSDEVSWIRSSRHCAKGVSRSVTWSVGLSLDLNAVNE